MEFRQLRYFVAVADLLHFSQAARRLRIAQPSLTQQIKSLETELGVRLFERGTRRVSITGAGQAYLKEARAILAKVEEAALAAHRANRGELGRLSMGFVGFAALDTLPDLVGPFQRRYPGVALQLYERSNEDQIRGVIEGTLDVGVVREPSKSHGVACKITLRDVQVLALPAGHRLAERKRVRLLDLRDEPFVVTPRDQGFALYDRLIGACANAGFSPRIVQEAVMMTTILGLVASKVGVAIVPSMATSIRLPSLVFRPLSPGLVIRTGIIWAPQSLPNNPVLRLLLATADEVFGAAP